MVLGADSPETMHQCQSARKLGISVRTHRNKLNEYGFALKDEDAVEEAAE